MTLLLSALIIGVFLGTVYALMALGMVASYRISRVVNLGQAGIAALGATVYWWMTATWGAPVVAALAGGVLASGIRDDLHPDGDAAAVRLGGQDPAAEPRQPDVTVRHWRVQRGPDLRDEPSDRNAADLSGGHVLGHLGGAAHPGRDVRAGHLRRPGRGRHRRRPHRRLRG